MLLFNSSVVFNSLWPHGLQHAKLSCPSLSPRVCSNSCPLNQWCHSTISSCYPLLLLPSVFPESGLFQTVGSSHQVAKVLEFQFHHLVFPLNIQDWFLLGLAGLISLQSNVVSRVFSNITVQKRQFFSTQPSLCSNSYTCTWLLEKS